MIGAVGQAMHERLSDLNFAAILCQDLTDTLSKELDSVYTKLLRMAQGVD